MTGGARRKASRADALARYQRERLRNRLAEPGPLPVVLVLDHLKAGYNVPKIFRSAQAFGALEVHLIGIGPFDPAPAKGAFRRVPARFYEGIHHSLERLGELGCTPFVLAAGAAEPLHRARLPERCAFLLGHEEFGFSFDPADHPGLGALAIPLLGPMESLNVSIAASIALYEYSRQHPADGRG